MPHTFIKKPIAVTAIQWNGKIADLGPVWEGCTTKEVSQDLGSDKLLIPTLEGDMTASMGDWIIKGVSGELYPCKPDIFAKTYYTQAEYAKTIGA